MRLCRYPSCLLDCGCTYRPYMVNELWKPVDPHKVDMDFLRDRMFILMYSQEPAPEVTLPPGKFLCLLCRRQGDMVDFDLTQEECRRRFGDVPLEDQFNLCDDCNTIVSSDLGIPL